MASAVMVRSATGEVRAGGAAASASARAAVSMGRSVLPRGVGRRPPAGRLDSASSPGGRLSGARGRPSSRGRLRTATGELSDVRRRSRPLQRSHAPEAGGGGVSPRPRGAAGRGHPPLPTGASTGGGADPPVAEADPGPPGRGRQSRDAAGHAGPLEGRKPRRTVRTPLEIPRPVDPQTRTTPEAQATSGRRWLRRARSSGTGGRRGGPECATPPCGGGSGVVEEDVVAEMPVLLSAAEVTLSPEARRTGVEGHDARALRDHGPGSVEGCEVLKGLPLADAAVLAALRARQYRPAQVAGRAVSVRHLFTIRDQADALSEPGRQERTFHRCRPVRRGARRRARGARPGSRRTGRSPSPSGPRRARRSGPRCARRSRPRCRTSRSRRRSSQSAGVLPRMPSTAPIVGTAARSAASVRPTIALSFTGGLSRQLVHLGEEARQRRAARRRS